MKRILFFVLSILLLSCSNSIKVSELKYKMEGRDCFVYDEKGKPFDGSTWSDDGKSYKLTVDCGILKKIEYYDEGGDLFCIVENDEKKFYNEKGSEITRDQVRELYWDKYMNWKHNQQAALREIVEQHLYNK